MSSTETVVWPEAIRDALPPATAPETEALRRRLLDVLLSPAEPPRMSYEEFLAWADEDTLAEWVDGEIIMTSPASDRHQDLARFLTSVLGIFVETQELGVIRPAPFQMKLEQGREPDLLFVAREHLDRLGGACLDGPADLVVEIVSPESAGRDRGEKFYEYARGGVPEYWLIDPQMESVEFYRLEGGRYRLAFSGEAGRYEARVLPGFWLRVEWLWQKPLPSPVQTVAEIVGLPATVRRLITEMLRTGEVPGWLAEVLEGGG